ncbi:hypothetical protein HT576_08620 [Haloterrigena sp. SYSU A121-1]|uniref:Uncharacterized protein n=1 Tax=Haloterrigena gelatinilytica TaxID=2741724 RepID=A0A8J8GNJ3_9EURY|nr:hypothetical protein [Haloterrigena gelatinilytica]NUB91082.1 hypothetical protein [Haloterrigena gelatinilytica]
MDLTWLILEETFILMVAIWLGVLLFAPLEHANAFWLTGAIHMITALGAAVAAHGPTSDMTALVAIETLVYCLLSSIIFARDYTDPDSDLGAADRLIGIAAYLGKLTSSNTGPRRPQRQHRPPGNRPNTPNQQEEQDHHGVTPAPDQIPDEGNLEDLVDDIDDFRR